MSRKRNSRPSAKASTSRTYGSTGAPAGTTNSWPVIFRWIVRATFPESSITSSLARRLTASIRRPRTAASNASGSWVRRVRDHDERAALISAPTIRGRRSRTTVSTSGSSGIGRRCVLARPDGHPFPVVADLDVDRQRHIERQGRLHRGPEYRDEPVDLVAGHLEEELVVDLEERPGPEAAFVEALAQADHRDLDDVGGRALDGHVDCHPLAGRPQGGIARVELGDRPLASEQGGHEALAPGNLLDMEHVVADPRIGREVRVDELLSLGPGNVGPARQAEVTHPIGNPEVDHLGHRALVAGDVLGRLVEDPGGRLAVDVGAARELSLIHISEPTRR